MSKPTGSLIFLGTDEFGATVLKALISSGCQISAVITKPDAKSGRGQRLISPPVKSVAKGAGLEVLQPVAIRNVGEMLTRTGWAVLASYGQIIPASILDKMSGGIINIHPSLLPIYRGPSPIETAILNGDRETGVSLMKLTAQMDTGPIYAQEKIALSTFANRVELGEVLAQKGAQMFLGSLDNILSYQMEPVIQDEAKATYTKLITKNDGLVNWDKSAEQIEREVRAYLGWPKSRAKLKHNDVILTQVRVATGPNDGILVQPCGKGWLEIQKLMAPSGRTMSGADFIHGYMLNK